MGRVEALESFLQLQGTDPLKHLKTTKGVFDYMNDPANYYGGDGTGPEVKIGFGVAANASNPLDEKAIAPLKDQLDLFLMNLDFRNKNREALDAINGWVAEQTNDKIKKLLEQVSEETVMMLINTLYLKASWTDPFKEEDTNPMKFTRVDGSSKQVPTMHRSGYMTYLDNDHFQAVSLNIELRDMEFWFLRPKMDVASLVDVLSKTPLKNALAEPHSQKINLSLPKFKIKNKIKLMDVLKKLGLEILTTSPNTELDGFFTEKGDFIVNEAIQGNFFAIDEKGVEAASATAMGMRAGGVPKPEEPIDLKFDKPFVFLMYSRTTGRLAFVGQVSDPAAN